VTLYLERGDEERGIFFRKIKLFNACSRGNEKTRGK
jgi:hypothetical protein